MIFALAAPLVLMFVIFGVELARVQAAKSRIVHVADAAALSAALLADKPVALSLLEKRAAQTVFAHFNREDVRFKVDVEGDKPPFEVRVTIEKKVPPLFPSSVLPLDMKVAHTGSATVAKTGPICALALASTGDAGLTVSGKAQINAPQCGVMVNNEHPETALHISGVNGLLDALFIYGVGGATGTGFSPTPEADRPPIVDPFLQKADWPVPGTCDYTDIRLAFGTHTLSPGVYCGIGIRLTSQARVTLLPGMYIFKDSDLHVGSQVELTGHGVSFFLTGQNSHLTIKDGVKLDLKPMSTGPLASLLVARRPDDIPKEKRPEFAGRGPSRVEGVVYMPGTHLQVGMELEPGFTPERLVFIGDQLTFRHSRQILHLVANGEAGYVSTSARITR